jgi:hypothetical protein
MKIPINIIIPSHNQPILTLLCIKSFETFKSQFEFKYIITESSSVADYKDSVCGITNNFKWINHKDPPRARGISTKVGVSIESALEHCEYPYTFLCDNDVMACNINWMRALYDKMQEGYAAVGTCVLNQKTIQALQKSGLLSTTSLLRKVSLLPKDSDPSLFTAHKWRPGADWDKGHWDCGELITAYCRHKGLRTYCFPGTTHTSNLESKLAPPYNRFHYIDRTVNDEGDVIYLHIGRGTTRTLGTYGKRGRPSIKDWQAFAEEHLF